MDTFIHDNWPYILAGLFIFLIVFIYFLNKISSEDDEHEQLMGECRRKTDDKAE